jgi:4-hydroxy-4-methyl-2-oxoglutarate aldolase
MSNLTLSDLEALRQYDTPTVCNAIELFYIRPRNTGYMDRRIQACFPEMPPVVGYASTATFRSAAPPRQGAAYPETEAQVAGFARLPGPALVVFQDLDEPSAAAVFGEVMCTTYQAFGAVGLITNGAGRDLDQVRALDFPVFTNGSICSHGYSHTPFIDVPVQVGGLTVYPGDLLHADRNGITNIPLEIAGEVAGVCAEVAAAEAIVLNYLKSGAVTVKGLEEARKAVRAAFAQTSQRVRRG